MEQLPKYLTFFLELESWRGAKISFRFLISKEDYEAAAKLGFLMCAVSTEEGSSVIRVPINLTVEELVSSLGARSKRERIDSDQFKSAFILKPESWEGSSSPQPETP